MRLLAWTMAALISLTAMAMAHASLSATSPVDGAVVETAPRSFSLTFSEPVSPLALKLIRPDGKSAELRNVELRDRTLEIVAPGDLGGGTHVITWRVVSADGHPIAGSVLFSVGEPSAAAPATGEEVDWTVRLGLWLTRIALYVGLFLGVGGVFARAILLPGVRSGSRVIWAALGIGLVGAVLGLGFQGLDALGATVHRIADPLIWSTGFGTSQGYTVVAALLAFLTGALALLTTGRLFAGAAVLGLFLAALAQLSAVTPVPPIPNG